MKIVDLVIGILRQLLITSIINQFVLIDLDNSRNFAIFKIVNLTNTCS